MSLNGYKIQRGNWTLTMLQGKGGHQLLEIWTLAKVCELVARDSSTTLKLMMNQLHINWEIMSRFLINILGRSVWILFHEVLWVNSHYLHSEVMRHGVKLATLFTWPLVSQPSSYSLKWKEPSKGPGGHLAQQNRWTKYNTFRCLQWLFCATLKCAKCVAVTEWI